MKKILFLDDDIGPLEYLIDIFETEFEVVAVDNLQSALEVLTDFKQQIDLIITDWHLGNDITAQDLFKSLQENVFERYKNIPIIVVSSDIDNKRWVEKHGGNFLLKPPKPKEIMELVAEKIGE